MKIKEYKNGNWAVLDKNNYLYVVKLYSASGNLCDKVLCDTYTDAKDYFKSFSLIAKNKTL
jgi:hypothetical protein